MNRHRYISAAMGILFLVVLFVGLGWWDNSRLLAAVTANTKPILRNYFGNTSSLDADRNSVLNVFDLVLSYRNATSATATPTQGSGNPTATPTRGQQTGNCNVNPPTNPSPSNPMPAIADPALNCSGYAEPRVWFESQSWWIEEGSKCFPGDHIHANACFPFMQKVRGQMPLNVTAVIHAANNSAEGPGTVNLYRIQVWDKVDPIHKEALSWTCPAGQNCVKTFNTVIDTTKSSSDGEGEFRVTFNIPCNKSSDKPTCDRFYNTARWFTIFDNGKSVNNFKHYDGSGGWYAGTDYNNAKVDRADMLKLAYTPLSGVVPIKVQGEKPELVVTVDSKNHGVDPGWVLYDGAGGDGKWVTVNMDTRNLANGYHKFFVRTCDTIDKGTGCGIHVVAFRVQN